MTDRISMLAWKRSTMLAVALSIAALVFWIDCIGALDAATSIGYLAALMLVAAATGEREVRWASAGCVLLTAASWAFAHAAHPSGASIARVIFATIAIGVTGALLVSLKRLQTAREEHSTSRADLQHFMDSVPQILWRATSDGVIDLYNKRYSDIVGRKHPEAITPDDWLQDFHPDDRDRCWDAIGGALAAGTEFQDLFRLKQADGSYRWMSLVGRPVQDHTSRTVTFYGGTTDVHEEVTAKEEAERLRRALEESQKELTTFLNLVPQILWRATPDAIVDFYNDRYNEVIGRDWRDTVANRDWLNDFHPDDRGWYQNRVVAAFAAGEELRATFRLRQADGTYRWTALVGRPVRDDEGRVLRYYGGTTDIHEEVTARERLELATAALEVSRAEAETFANSVPHFLWRSDLNGRVLHMNERFQEITGVDGKDLVAHPGEIAIVHPDDLASVEASKKAGLAAGTVWHVQARIRQTDGRYRWMQLYDRPVVSASTGVTERFGGAVDIHDEVSAREDLRRTKDELEGIRAELERFADSVPQIQWRLDENDRVDYLNLRYTELTGHDRSEAIAKQNWGDLYAPGDLDMAWQRFRDAAASGADEVNFLYRLRHRDGDYRWMRLSGRAQRCPETGRIVGWYGGTVDAQEEVLAQDEVRTLLATLEERVEERTAELLETEARYTSLFEVSNMTFAEMDFSGTHSVLDDLRSSGVTDVRRYFQENPDELARTLALVRTVRVNQALARLLGYQDVAELVSNPPAQNATDGDEVMLRQLEMAFDGAGQIDGRTTLVGKDGIQIQVYYTVIRLADGLHLSSHLNLSQQERINDLHRAAQDELARANRVATVGAFSASIAHELNQPIASMVMDAQTGLRWLRRDQPDIAATDKVLERLARTAQRMASIVQRTRDAIVAGNRSVEPVDLSKLIVETRDLLEPTLRRGDINLEVIDPSGAAMVMGDPVELQQVLVNLINNSADAMRGWSGRRLITLSLHETDDEVAVSVADTGPGIEDEHLDKLFQPFFTTKKLGIGMGLQICRSAIEGLGGTLSAGNVPDGGACFTFTLGRVADGEIRPEERP